MDGRLRRSIKEYIKRPGYIRVSFLDKPYRWWRYRSPDGKNAIIPIFLSLFSGVGMYLLAIYMSEWEALIKEKAKISEEFSEQNI